jgi:hypothetical protein
MDTLLDPPLQVLATPRMPWPSVADFVAALRVECAKEQREDGVAHPADALVEKLARTRLAAPWLTDALRQLQREPQVLSELLRGMAALPRQTGDMLLLVPSGLVHPDRLPFRHIDPGAARGRAAQLRRLRGHRGGRPAPRDLERAAPAAGRAAVQARAGDPAGLHRRAVLVDLAAMRAAVARLGGDPKKINPLVPVDLVIDHSVQVDYFGASDSLARNVQLEFHRNRERYTFLRWGQNAFQELPRRPAGTGIVHQVNLEYLAQGVLTRQGREGEPWPSPTPSSAPTRTPP